jgi:hypothetical protein
MSTGPDGSDKLAIPARLLHRSGSRLVERTGDGSGYPHVCGGRPQRMISLSRASLLG